MRRARATTLPVCALLLVLILFLGGCTPGQGTVTSSTTTAPATTITTTTGTTTPPFTGDPNLNEPGVFPICKQTVSLTIGVPQHPNVQDFATNYQTKLLEERGNFSFSFETFPSTEFVQKVTLMIASGGSDLPDVLMITPGDASVFEWGKNGYIQTLNDYYEHSSFYLNEAADRTGIKIVPMITSPDGNIYNIPTFNQSPYNETLGRCWVNSDWLSNLNLGKPVTPDELYSVLKAFRDDDPNGNSKKDEIPMISYSASSTNYIWFLYLMAPFQFLSSDINNGWVVKNGEISAYYALDSYREGLRYIHKLAAEGLLSPLSLTQDEAQFMAILDSTPMVCGVISNVAPTRFGDPMRQYSYETLEPLKAADGSQPTAYQPSVPIPGMIISKNCQTPEAAFRLGDLMVSQEFSTITRWGEKGVDWVEPDPGEKGSFEAAGYPATIKAILPWGQPQNKMWCQVGPYIRQYGIALGLTGAAASTDPALQAKSDLSAAIFATKYFNNKPDEMVAKLIFTKEETEAINEIITNLNTYKKECIAAFVTGKMDVEKDWQKYLNELKTIGLDKAQTTVQAVYDRMYR